MIFRKPVIAICAILGMSFAGGTVAQDRIGDWEFRVLGKDDAAAAKEASTHAREHVDATPTPRLVIRRTGSKGPVELLVTQTHDQVNDNCDYKDWKVTIDRTEVPVLGYTFEPAKTELKTKLGTPDDLLWDSFRKGLQLTVQVEKKCDSTSGASNPETYRFSLRGSAAVYMFVAGTGE